MADAVNQLAGMAEDFLSRLNGTQKEAFMPMPGGQAPPMDPAAAGGDPAMMGVDPSMMGMDPSMMGMDPAAAGGAPPAPMMPGQAPPPTGSDPNQVTVSIDDLKQFAQETGGGGAAPAAGGGGGKAGKDAVIEQLSAKLDLVLQGLTSAGFIQPSMDQLTGAGAGADPAAAGGAGAMVGSPEGAAGSPNTGIPPIDPMSATGAPPETAAPLAGGMEVQASEQPTFSQMSAKARIRGAAARLRAQTKRPF